MFKTPVPYFPKECHRKLMCNLMSKMIEVFYLKFQWQGSSDITIIDIIVHITAYRRYFFYSDTIADIIPKIIIAEIIIMNIKVLA